MKYKYVLYIFIICIVLLMLYVHTIKNLPSVPIKSAMKQCQTGDLVLFRWFEVSPLHDLISTFTHVGMVVEIDGTKYIIESHLKGDTKHMGVHTGGVHLYDFDKRLSSYEGYKYLVKLKKHPSPNATKRFIANIPKYKQIPFYDDYTGYFKNICLPNRFCKSCVQRRDRQGMFCSEFIGFCLKELQILEQDFDYHCLVPGDIPTLKINGNHVFDKIENIQ